MWALRGWTLVTLWMVYKLVTVIIAGRWEATWWFPPLMIAAIASSLFVGRAWWAEWMLRSQTDNDVFRGTNRFINKPMGWETQPSNWRWDFRGVDRDSIEGTRRNFLVDADGQPVDKYGWLETCRTTLR